MTHKVVKVKKPFLETRYGKGKFMMGNDDKLVIVMEDPVPVKDGETENKNDDTLQVFKESLKRFEV